MLTVFDPVQYSIAENQFLLNHIGKAPIVALKSAGPDVNLKAVKPILDRVYELIELERHDGEKWVGIEPIKEKITTYLRVAQKWREENRRGKLRFPSMFSYDSRGRAFRSGPGSDNTQVRTYFDEKGNRVPFAIDLIPPMVVDEIMPIESVGEGAPEALVTDHVKKRIECLVCGHTESYQDGVRRSYIAARARMSRHMRAAKDEQDRHREAHTAEFGSPDGKR